VSLARIVLAAAAVYAIFCAAVFLFQDGMIYQPFGRLELYPSAAGLDYEDVNFSAPDGISLHGWFIPAGKTPSGVLLFFHGNAGNISHRLDSIRIFHDLGLDVFIFDYRGYGLSAGKPSEEGFYADGRAALGFLLEKGYSPGEVILFGRSLGGAVAARIAGETTPAALIIESSFTSLAAIAARVAPLFPVGLLLRSGFHTEALLPAVRCPVLVIHSPDDEMIPFSHGKRLFEAASEPKAFLETSGDHNSGFLLSGAVYTEGLASFISALP